MDDIKELIRLVNSAELYDAKEKLNKITKDKLEQYKQEIIKNIDVFNKNG